MRGICHRKVSLKTIEVIPRLTVKTKSLMIRCEGLLFELEPSLDLGLTHC